MRASTPQTTKAKTGGPSNGTTRFFVPRCQANGDIAMLYTHPPEPSQLLRTRCRSARCGIALKVPTDNPRDAFCCESCKRTHYAFLCMVCETPITKGSRKRVVCWRSKCRHALQRHPEKYRLLLGHNAEKLASATTPRKIEKTAEMGQFAQENSTKSTPKTAQKSGRGLVVIASPTADFAPNQSRELPGQHRRLANNRSTQLDIDQTPLVPGQHHRRIPVSGCTEDQLVRDANYLLRSRGPSGWLENQSPE